MLITGSVVVIGALLLSLSAWRSQTTRPAVAVLAFAEYSTDPQLGGIAARLTDDVTSELARLGRVDVVSHTSAMQFADDRRSLREIAGALQADFVVEGTIAAEPGGIKVVARIVNAATDRKAWVEDYHGKADALPDLSRAIAQDIAAAVLTLVPAR
jgi:TolB-like protein